MKKLTNIKKKISSTQSDELLQTLKTRFNKNMQRHKGLDWDKVQTKLESNNEKMWSLFQMEETGGEPDVVDHDKKTGDIFFMIVLLKVLRGAGAFVTTMRHWNLEKNINLLIAQKKWRMTWE